MNKRIEEIAEQAWVYQMTVYEHNGVRTFGEREKVFSKEKFVELIVRECTDICLSMQIGNQYTPEEMLFQAKYREIIKEHFGVSDV